MSNYPPGVSGNEPQITGEWPCNNCGGFGYFGYKEDFNEPCVVCYGTGIIPEDVVDKSDTEDLIQKAIDDAFGYSVPLDFIYDRDDDSMSVSLNYAWIRGTSWLREK